MHTRMSTKARGKHCLTLIETSPTGARPLLDARPTMGGCCSSFDEHYESNHDDPHHGQSNSGMMLSRGGNRPFKRPGSWTSEGDITLGQLQSQRDAYWDTAPAYEGRREIWNALRTVCELGPEDNTTAQAILDSVGISIPTGDLTDGCYDELGNRYVIPIFCIVEPSNLVEVQNTTIAPIEVTSVVHSTNSKIIKVRLSTTSKDVLINADVDNDTVKTLKSRIIDAAKGEKDTSAFACRLVFKGFEMVDAKKLVDFDIQEGEVVQALLRELE